MPSWLSPPTARRKGIRLLSSDGTNDSMTNEDHDKKVNQVASCKTQESVNIHTATEATLKSIPCRMWQMLMPFAGAIMAGAHAGWSLKLDRSRWGRAE
ncbi:unnamed protein product [Sphagnum jensenii]|uniref:Uncharacterized protein n=1 Tax=Sphagnum jensenii TaxID=128206 RepID=A0ABP0VQG9_9BRYO